MDADRLARRGCQGCRFAQVRLRAGPVFPWQDAETGGGTNVGEVTLRGRRVVRPRDDTRTGKRRTRDSAERRAIRPIADRCTGLTGEGAPVNPGSGRHVGLRLNKCET